MLLRYHLQTVCPGYKRIDHFQAFSSVISLLPPTDVLVKTLSISALREKIRAASKKDGVSSEMMKTIATVSELNDLIFVDLLVTHLSFKCGVVYTKKLDRMVAEVVSQFATSFKRKRAAAAVPAVQVNDEVEKDEVNEIRKTKIRKIATTLVTATPADIEKIDAILNPSSDSATAINNRVKEKRRRAFDTFNAGRLAETRGMSSMRSAELAIVNAIYDEREAFQNTVRSFGPQQGDAEIKKKEASTSVALQVARRNWRDAYLLMNHGCQTVQASIMLNTQVNNV